MVVGNLSAGVEDEGGVRRGGGRRPRPHWSAALGVSLDVFFENAALRSCPFDAGEVDVVLLSKATDSRRGLDFFKALLHLGGGCVMRVCGDVGHGGLGEFALIDGGEAVGGNGREGVARSGETFLATAGTGRENGNGEVLRGFARLSLSLPLPPCSQ